MLSMRACSSASEEEEVGVLGRGLADSASKVW